jgi:hypothetical protein
MIFNRKKSSNVNNEKAVKPSLEISEDIYSGEIDIKKVSFF